MTIAPERIAQIEARRDELAAQMATGDLPGDRFVAVSKEYAELEPVAAAAGEVRRLRAESESLTFMTQDADDDLRAMAVEELHTNRAQLESAERALALALLPRDAADERAAMLEIRAGTGGDEAAIFAGDLFRMYSRYAERQGWRIDVESASPGEHGGYREIIASVDGAGAYARLKFESGTHRVQRVPETESQGRIHTSAATVAIIPVEDDTVDIVLNPADLRVDTFRSSGAGGQHVNKTDSAIRITHMPTGVVVESQTERSQHANRDKAMKRLRAMLAEAEAERRAAATAEIRKLQVGSGDRSQRIRTYNYPQGRITDHRVEGLTLYDLPNVLEGNVDALVDRLSQEHQADALAALTRGT